MRWAASGPAAAAFRWAAASPLVGATLRRLDDLERRDPPTVASWQAARAGAFRRRWAARTPYYRSRPALLDDPPVLGKADVQAAPDAFRNRLVPARTVTTGGTSGSPLHLRISLGSFFSEWAHIGYAWASAGVALTDPKITFRGASLGAGFGAEPIFYQPTYHHLVVSPFHLNDAVFRDLVRRAEELRPRAIWGYPSAITPFARWVERTGPHPALSRVRAVLLASEGAYDWQLELFARAFGATVVQWYGQSEKVAFAVGCPTLPGRYHVVPTYGLLEDAGGRLVGSGVTNPAMPLVRYDTEDAGVLSPGPCGCGMPFPLLTGLRGRWDQALVYGAGDEPISTTALNFHDEIFAAFDRFQFSQVRAGEVTLRVCGSGPLSTGVLRSAREVLQQRVGSQLAVSVEVVAGSELLTARGKVATVDQRYVPGSAS